MYYIYTQLSGIWQHTHSFHNQDAAVDFAKKLQQDWLTFTGQSPKIKVLYNVPESSFNPIIELS